MMIDPWWKFLSDISNPKESWKLTEFNIQSIATEKLMGVLEHCVTMMSGKGQTMEMVRKTKWNLMEEAKYLPPFDECP